MDGLMATIPEITVDTVTLPNVEHAMLDTTKFLSEFEADCADRHLTHETIGRYKSPLKLFFTFLKERNQKI